MKNKIYLMNLWKSVMKDFKGKHPQYAELLKINKWKAGVRWSNSGKFGWADNKTREVIVNEFLHRNSTDDMIIDTMLHEIAHAIDFCQRNTSDHGIEWKKIAKEVGANPVARGKKAVKVVYKYVCVYKEDEVTYHVLRGFHRKPSHYSANKVMPDTFMKGKRDESLGKVWLYTWEKWCTVCRAIGKSPYKEEN